MQGFLMVNADVFCNIRGKKVFIRFGAAADVDETAGKIFRRRLLEQPVVDAVDQNIFYFFCHSLYHIINSGSFR